jgi:Fungal chitosanase of glycosyl hydrolase group 75
MTYNPPSASSKRLGTIVQKITPASPIKKQFVKPPKILAKLPGGEIYFDSALELDTDGWPDGKGKGDSSWQPQTSLRYANKDSLNANAVPYFVLPLPGSWFNSRGCALGDYAAVIFKDQLAFAVFADLGPAKKLGEGSIELLRRLGEERIKANGKVRNAGMGPRVITIVFPGSGRAVHRKDQATLLTAITKVARPLFETLGGNIA